MTGKLTLLETVRALLVLALVFLNFAHQPALALSPDHDVMSVVASQSSCGAPITADEGHVLCHACRIGSGADLPPVAALPCPPIAVAARLHAEPAAIAVERQAPLPLGARAPPVA